MERVFMTKTEKSVLETKMVGVHIPKDNANRLALLSLTQGVPRTHILKSIINDYLDEQPSLDKLIKKSINMAFDGWKKMKGQNGAKEKFSNYLSQTADDLSSNRMEQGIIDAIIKGLKGRYES